jgi:tetratricopeptide (TPR) repeat protein
VKGVNKMDKNPLKRSKGLLIFLCIFLLVVVSCQLVSGYITVPESQRLPSAIPNDGTGKVNPSWSSIPYKTTGINYTIQIVDDLTRRPVWGCSKVYWLNDSYPSEHSPIRGGSIEFTIPERSEAGTYWLELNYYSREAGAEFHSGCKIFIAESLGDLAITKFEDLNNNKYRDDNEPGLQDWEFSITDPYGESYNKITDTDGIIYLPNVSTGDYIVQEILKPEQRDMRWYNTTLLEQTVTVEEGKTTNVRFGNYISTRLIIIKFNDTNQNYIIDDEDERLRDWTFIVRDPDGNTIPYPTDDIGEIRKVVPWDYEGKDYKIEEIPKPGWKLIKKDTNAPILEEGKEWITIRVEKGKESTVKFLNSFISNGTLLIHKFHDSNRNKVYDYDEEGLANWEFSVTQDGETVDTCKTNETGFCALTLKPGRYGITENKKKGWIATTPLTQEKEVRAGQITNAIFGNTMPPLIISKFYDQNLNGKKDSGEERLANWKFIITQDGNEVATGKTDNNGTWAVQELLDGDYTITEQPNHCWRSSNTTSQIVKVRTDNSLNIEFGNYEVGTLSIYKFNDTNHNGNWDAGELPLSNWGFRVKDPKDFIDISKYEYLTTDNGSITLELPADLSYIVTDTFRVGWRNSTPSMQSVYIRPCEDNKVYFGNYINTPIVIYKFNDANKDGNINDSEEGLAGWDFRITGPGVDKIITTDEKGKARFDDAIPGLYSVEEIMRKDQRDARWTATTPPIIKNLEVEEGKTVTVEFGNRLKGDRCAEYGIYMDPEHAPRWHRRSDMFLNVSKYLDPHIVHCDNSNRDEGEIINVALRVCVLPVMEPTDLVIAVDTSGSVVERGWELLEIMRNGIIGFIENNEARFGENVRIGFVNWDEDIDETVDLTTDYEKIKKACGNLSGNLQEFTVYQEGLNGSIEAFTRSPRVNAKKVIVFITDAKGEYKIITKFPDSKEYTIHAIVVGPTKNEEIVNTLGDLTRHYEGKNEFINETSYELEEELTTLIVSSIGRKTLNNVTVVETLPKYMRALNGSYAIPPTSEHISSEGQDWNTVTMAWEIGDMSSDECWENTFKAVFCCRMPADVIQPEGISRITSEVTYSDPTNSSITRHLFIPEGGIWIRPLPWWKLVPQWLWVLLGAFASAIIALATYGYMKVRRINELSSEVKNLKDTIEPIKPIKKMERLEESEIRLDRSDTIRTATAIINYFEQKYQLPPESEELHEAVAKFTGESLEGIKAMMLRFTLKSLVRCDVLTELFEEMGSPLEALKEESKRIEKEIIASSKHWETYKNINKAVELTKIGNYKEALGIYDSLIEEDPENLDILFNKGVVLLKKNKYEDAIVDFDKIIEIDSNYEEAWLMKGVAYHGLNNLEEEENCYDKALEIDPAYAKALFNKATLLQEKGRFEDARRYYNKAVKADPTLESYRSEFIFKKRQSPG